MYTIQTDRKLGFQYARSVYPQDDVNSKNSEFETFQEVRNSYLGLCCNFFNTVDWLERGKNINPGIDIELKEVTFNSDVELKIKDYEWFADVDIEGIDTIDSTVLEDTFILGPNGQYGTYFVIDSLGNARRFLYAISDTYHLICL